MNTWTKSAFKKSPDKIVRGSVHHFWAFLWLSLSFLACGAPALAQSQPPPLASGGENGQPAVQGATPLVAQRQTEPTVAGSISGTIVDSSGAVVTGARVTLTREDQSPTQETVSGEDGKFDFANIAPGPFLLTIRAPNLATQTVSGTLHPGEACVVPPISMAVAAAFTEVHVTPSQVELAEAQIKEQEKQRVLAVFPNFYVTYVHDAVPLTPRQKFELAWKTSVDPVSFAIVGLSAGLQQATNQYGGYGQGAEGYGKRFGATYGDFVSSTFIGGAILPSILKQDPRYFYKGTGTKRSRLLYAVATAVICKGDNGHWQPNYSGILGSLAAGGLSNLYYPDKDRGGAELAFESAAIGIAETAAINILQEFVVRKFTPNHSNRQAAKP